MDELFLKQALSLALPRLGFCAPNPAVGAVLARGDRVIAQGYHTACGAPHAEIEALKIAGAQAQGATLYITLEPCCHWGKTPPCTDQIIQSGVSRVVFAYQDPNPAVNGKGMTRCLQAGIECLHLPVSEITAFYRPYRFWVENHRPWVTCKMAITLDGKIALQSGKPLPLTGKKLAMVTHQGRSQSDAILTTIQTILMDNPSLNVRLNEPESVQAKPLYILDTQARLPLNANIFNTSDFITVLHGKSAPTNRLQALQQQGAHLIQIAETVQGLDLPQVLKTLGSAGHHQCWVEAGGKLFASLYTQQLIQQLLLYISTQTLADTGYNAFMQAMDFRQAKSIAWKSLEEEAYCEVHWE